MNFENLALDMRLPAALNLLERVCSYMERAPDQHWWRDYFLLTGQHVIRTDEGWEPGSAKQSIIEDFGADAILDEVNAP